MPRSAGYRRRPSDYIVMGILLAVVLGVIGGWFLGSFGSLLGAAIGGTYFAVGVVAQGVLVGTRAARRDQSLAGEHSRQLH